MLAAGFCACLCRSTLPIILIFIFFPYFYGLKSGTMKKYLLLCVPLFIVSCTVEEVQKARLLEYDIKGQTFSYEGYAFRYNDYVNNIKIGYDFHIYNLGQSALSIEAFDSTFAKMVYNFPEFEAEYRVEMPYGQSKTYKASRGQFRFLGTQLSDLTGDFHFTVKNVMNPNDSIIISNGYFRIYLDQRDRVFSK